MATFSKIVLSGSTDGRLIKVAQTATAGTTIHTGSATATTIDELWLYAVNSDSTDRKLTIEWGGVDAPDDLIEQTIDRGVRTVSCCCGSCHQRQCDTAGRACVLCDC
jgi:hypothetical protein